MDALDASKRFIVSEPEVAEIAGRLNIVCREGVSLTASHEIARIVDLLGQLPRLADGWVQPALQLEAAE